MHTYEIRPRKDHRGVDLISDALPFGRLTTRFSIIAPPHKIAPESTLALSGSEAAKRRPKLPGKQQMIRDVSRLNKRRRNRAMKLEINVPVSGLDLASLLDGEQGLFLCQNRGQNYITVAKAGHSIAFGPMPIGNPSRSKWQRLSGQSPGSSRRSATQPSWLNSLDHY